MNMKTENSKVVKLRVKKKVKEASVPPSAKDILAATVNNIDMVAEFTALKTNKPNIESVSLRLAEYVTHLIPGGHEGVTLLEESLQKGIESWYACYENTQDSRKSYAEFLRALLKQLPRIYDYIVYVDEKKKRVVWNAMDGGLSSWWAYKKKTPLVIKKKEGTLNGKSFDNEYIRTKILFEVMTHSDLMIVNDNIEMIVGRA